MTRARRRRVALGLTGGVALGLALVPAPVLAAAPGPAGPTASSATTTLPTTALPATALPTTALPAAPASDGDFPVDVTITQVSPQVLAPGDDLTMVVTLRNTGTTPVVQPEVVVHLDTRSYISRTSLDRWRHADPHADAGRVVLRSPLTAPLEPGAGVTARVTVPAADVGLPSRASEWGARALAVGLVDAAETAATSRLGLARTFALWFPPQEVTATRVSVLAPLVGGAVDPFDDAWVAELEELTGPDGRLGSVLAATADHPDVTWFLDPWLTDVTAPDAEPEDEQAAAQPGEPSDDPTTGTENPTDAAPVSGATGDAGPLARAWAEQLFDATIDRDVVLLPYGDSDLAALAHAGATGVLATALELSTAVAARTPLPDAADTAIAWPADMLPDQVTATLVAASGGDAVVVGPGELPAPSVLTYTPSGRTTVATAAGEVAALIPDERLSTALTTGFVRSAGPDADAPGEGPDDVAPAEAWGGHLSPASAAQDLLAELAVITRERPADARHMLLTVPRDWDPDPLVADAQLDALESAPWVRWEPVTALVGSPDARVDRGTLPAERTDPAEISAIEIGTLTEAVASRRRLVQMFEDPAAHLAGAESQVLAPLSVAWRPDPEGRRAVVEQAVAATETIRSGVTADQGSPVNLISTSGELPVRVLNALADPVTVEVMPRPGDSRLLVEKPVLLTVPARGEATAMVPVHAIQSADLAVRVELSTPDGVLVDDSTVLTVRVRAEWEGIGTAVIGVLLALGVVVGVIRTIRRGRTGSRSAPVDSGPDALSPEQAAAPEQAATPEETPPPEQPAAPEQGSAPEKATSPGEAAP